MIFSNAKQIETILNYIFFRKSLLVALRYCDLPEVEEVQQIITEIRAATLIIATEINNEQLESENILRELFSRFDALSSNANSLDADIINSKKVIIPSLSASFFLLFNRGDQSLKNQTSLACINFQVKSAILSRLLSNKSAKRHVYDCLKRKSSSMPMSFADELYAFKVQSQQPQGLIDGTAIKFIIDLYTSINFVAIFEEASQQVVKSTSKIYKALDRSHADKSIKLWCQSILAENSHLALFIRCILKDAKVNYDYLIEECQEPEQERVYSYYNKSKVEHCIYQRVLQEKTTEETAIIYNAFKTNIDKLVSASNKNKADIRRLQSTERVDFSFNSTNVDHYMVSTELYMQIAKTYACLNYYLDQVKTKIRGYSKIALNIDKSYSHLDIIKNFKGFIDHQTDIDAYVGWFASYNHNRMPSLREEASEGFSLYSYLVDNAFLQGYDFYLKQISELSEQRKLIAKTDPFSQLYSKDDFDRLPEISPDLLRRLKYKSEVYKEIAFEYSDAKHIDKEDIPSLTYGTTLPLLAGTAGSVSHANASENESSGLDIDQTNQNDFRDQADLTYLIEEYMSLFQQRGFLKFYYNLGHKYNAEYALSDPNKDIEIKSAIYTDLLNCNYIYSRLFDAIENKQFKKRLMNILFSFSTDTSKINNLEAIQNYAYFEQKVILEIYSKKSISRWFDTAKSYSAINLNSRFSDFFQQYVGSLKSSSNEFMLIQGTNASNCGERYTFDHGVEFSLKPNNAAINLLIDGLEELENADKKAATNILLTIVFLRTYLSRNLIENVTIDNIGPLGNSVIFQNIYEINSSARVFNFDIVLSKINEVEREINSYKHYRALQLRKRIKNRVDRTKAEAFKGVIWYLSKIEKWVKCEQKANILDVLHNFKEYLKEKLGDQDVIKGRNSKAKYILDLVEKAYNQISKILFQYRHIIFGINILSNYKPYSYELGIESYQQLVGLIIHAFGSSIFSSSSVKNATSSVQLTPFQSSLTRGTESRRSSVSNELSLASSQHHEIQAYSHESLGVVSDLSSAHYTNTQLLPATDTSNKVFLGIQIFINSVEKLMSEIISHFYSNKPIPASLEERNADRYDIFLNILIKQISQYIESTILESTIDQTTQEHQRNAERIRSKNDSIIMSDASLGQHASEDYRLASYLAYNPEECLDFLKKYRDDLDVKLLFFRLSYDNLFNQFFRDNLPGEMISHRVMVEIEQYYDVIKKVQHSQLHSDLLLSDEQLAKLIGAEVKLDKTAGFDIDIANYKRIVKNFQKSLQNISRDIKINHTTDVQHKAESMIADGIDNEYLFKIILHDIGEQNKSLHGYDVKGWWERLFSSSAGRYGKVAKGIKQIINILQNKKLSSEQKIIEIQKIAKDRLNVKMKKRQERISHLYQFLSSFISVSVDKAREAAGSFQNEHLSSFLSNHQQVVPNDELLYQYHICLLTHLKMINERQDAFVNYDQQSASLYLVEGMSYIDYSSLECLGAMITDRVISLTSGYFSREYMDKLGNSLGAYSEVMIFPCLSSTIDFIMTDEFIRTLNKLLQCSHSKLIVIPFNYINMHFNALAIDVSRRDFLVFDSMPSLGYARMLRNEIRAREIYLAGYQEIIPQYQGDFQHENDCGVLVCHFIKKLLKSPFNHGSGSEFHPLYAITDMYHRGYPSDSYRDELLRILKYPVGQDNLNYLISNQASFATNSGLRHSFEVQTESFEKINVPRQEDMQTIKYNYWKKNEVILYNLANTLNQDQLVEKYQLEDMIIVKEAIFASSIFWRFWIIYEYFVTLSAIGNAKDAVSSSLNSKQSYALKAQKKFYLKSGPARGYSAGIITNPLIPLMGNQKWKFACTQEVYDVAKTRDSFWKRFDTQFSTQASREYLKNRKRIYCTKNEQIKFVDIKSAEEQSTVGNFIVKKITGSPDEIIYDRQILEGFDQIMQSIVRLDCRIAHTLAYFISKGRVPNERTKHFNSADRKIPNKETCQKELERVLESVQSFTLQLPGKCSHFFEELWRKITQGLDELSNFTIKPMVGMSTLGISAIYSEIDEYIEEFSSQINNEHGKIAGDKEKHNIFVELSIFIRDISFLIFEISAMKRSQKLIVPGKKIDGKCEARATCGNSIRIRSRQCALCGSHICHSCANEIKISSSVATSYICDLGIDIKKSNQYACQMCLITNRELQQRGDIMVLKSSSNSSKPSDRNQQHGKYYNRVMQKET